MDSIQVRLIGEDDRPALLAVLTSSADFPQQMLGSFRRRGDRYETFGAWLRGEMGGVLTGSFDSDFRESGAFDSFDLPPAPHAFLVRVHVHESARDRGVGRALVGAYTTEAASRGCTFVGGQIDLASDSSARRAFFVRLGFAIRDLDNFGARPSGILA